MYIYWLYSILTIFYCWLLFKITSSYKIIIVFYSITVSFIIFHFLSKTLINKINNEIYLKKLKNLKCMKAKVNKGESVCNNTYYCKNNYFCDSHEPNSCKDKSNIGDLIEKKIIEINIEKDEKLQDTLKFLDKYYIRHKTLDQSLNIYIIYISFIFLFIFLFKMNNGGSDIQLNLSGLNLNYIRKKLQ